MSASDKPGTPAGEVLAALPRTRPQRRSARRQSAASAAAVGPVAEGSAAPATATPRPSVKKATKKPSAKKVAMPTPKAVAKATPKAVAKAAPTKATPKAVARPTAKRPTKTAAKAAGSQPLLDHPVPADIPGAPFAPPPTGAARAAAGPDAGTTDSTGHDVVSVALEAAGGLVQAGVGLAKTILGRLPRP